MSMPYPEAARLGRDVARLRRHEGNTLGSIMSRAVLAKLVTSKKKDKFRVAYTEALGAFDTRIRFVEGNRQGRPKGTIKLFGALELAPYRCGQRIVSCLGGGVVIVATTKESEVDSWRLAGIHEFLPMGRDLKACEDSLESLSQAFELRNPDEPFPALSDGPFQIRTGSSAGGYSVYLLASHIFGAKSE